MSFFTKYRPYILFCFVAVIAIFFRLAFLQTTPPGLYPDEAINGMDALSAIDTGHYKIFYPDNNGREGLWMNIISLSLRFTGNEPYGIRLVSAILGILSVLGLFLLVKELFEREEKKGGTDKYWLAFMASFFMATSFWHVNFSRIGFRGIIVPFLLIYSFYFLLNGIRTKNTMNYIISGVFFGLGFHTYIAFRVAPVILFAFIFFEITNYWIKNRPFQNLSFKKLYFNDGWFRYDFLVLALIITALPIGIYFWNNPADFTGRTAQVSIFAADNPLLAGLKNLGTTMAMFSFRGDCNWRHNMPCNPQLFWPIGILFLIGFVITLKKLALGVKDVYIGIKAGVKKEFNAVDWFLMAWFFSMILPAVFSNEGLPHALRTIGVIPVVFIFCAIGAKPIINKLLVFFKKLPPIQTYFLYALFVLFLLINIVSTYKSYFIDWSLNPETKTAFSQSLVDTGNILNFYPADYDKYAIINEDGVLVDGIPMPAQTIKFITYNKSKVKYILPDQIESIDANKKFIAIAIKYDSSLKQKFREMFPGKIKFISNNNLLLIKNNE